MRGSVVYKATGLPFENLKMFGPLEALACFAEAVHVALTQFWPTYLIFPLLYFSWRAGVKLPWGVGAVFGILPLGYCFYFYQADRFYLELLPFAMVGTAFLLDRLAQSSKLATLVMVGLLLATMLVGTVMKAIDRRQEYESRNSFAEAVERARTEHSRLLVFVRDRFPGPTEPFLEALYWYNIEDFPSNVIVARDLGEPNCMLTQRFPDHFAVLVSAVTKAQNDGLFVPEVRPLACFKS
jgi:hypothetical protein